ncbi:MAG: hydroxymethylglutaryl-CoA lyase [Aestuariivita sp.]|nr:hydroxymethylglutaryl-CoA lyase [Aestuariivita sp.]
MKNFVEIFEVGPRDGLQNERSRIALDDKIAFINLLSRGGFRRIECASFVSPKWVPQMADSAEVMDGIERTSTVSYAALTPNLRGFERAVMARVDEVSIFGSASEGFSKANINTSISESLERFTPIMLAAKEENLPVRGYISCVTDCPYDGSISPESVAKVANELLLMGCYEIALGDTLGKGTPEKIHNMLTSVTEDVPINRLAGHFHDTNGLALANIDVALDFGIRVFDAAVGGLGGCPYAPGAAGNVATEKVVCHLESLGFETGLDSSIVDQAVGFARQLRGKYH